MIVTACAADRHAEKRRAHGLHDFIHAIRAGLANRRGLLPNRGRWHMRSGNEKACCFAHAILIACDLITHELIVRTIFIESSDDIVAIDPRILPIEIRFGAIRLRPSDHIEPVLRPTLTKARRGEQLFDQPGIRRFIVFF